MSFAPTAGPAQGTIAPTAGPTQKEAVEEGNNPFAFNDNGGIATSRLSTGGRAKTMTLEAKDDSVGGGGMGIGTLKFNKAAA